MSYGPLLMRCALPLPSTSYIRVWTSHSSHPSRIPPYLTYLTLWLKPHVTLHVKLGTLN